VPIKIVLGTLTELMRPVEISETTKIKTKNYRKRRKYA
jgi:hypothetical protein